MYLSDCLPCNGTAIPSLKGVSVRAIVCHARARNIHLQNVPEHFPSGSFVLLKSITTAPTRVKKRSFEIHLGRSTTKIFGPDRACFALLELPSLQRRI